MGAEMMQSKLILEVQLRASVGQGWEDIWVAMLKQKLVAPNERDAFRRYVLGLARECRRYGT